MSEAVRWSSKKVKEPEQKKGMASHQKKQIGAAVGCVVVGAASYLIYQAFTYVSTDNAQVGAHSTLLSSRVSGIITRAEVDENQVVKKGQLLVEIKADDFQNSVNQLESETQALAAQVKGAELSFNRTTELLAQGASTQERLDAAEAQFLSLQNKWKSARAQAAEARLNLGYTRVLAPADGKVGKKSFEVGMLAGVGQPLIGFVPSDQRWVTANIKETDLSDVYEGKKAYVIVDAIPGREFEGIVESISPATGATFTLLPPDNATGNFTKVVQRVPVRIKLLNLTANDMERLQIGLSAEVKIRVR